MMWCDMTVKSWRTDSVMKFPFLVGLLPWLSLRGRSACQALSLCRGFPRAGVQVTAYCTDRVLAEKTDEMSDRLIFYGEPTPESVGPLLDYLEGRPVQKMLVMADSSRSDELRPRLMLCLGGQAEITTAIPGMLEVSHSPSFAMTSLQPFLTACNAHLLVGRPGCTAGLHPFCTEQQLWRLQILPAGASKGIGVGKLLEHMGVAPENLMALGDGENDVEMLQVR